MAVILMAKIGTASFVERDEKILAERHTVKVFQFAGGGFPFILSTIRFWLWIFSHIWTADLLFARFAHYHSFLLGLAGIVFRKKLAIVIGGSDAVWIPKYRYGVYAHPLSRRTTSLALHMADLLLPVHRSLIHGTNSFSDDPPRTEGLLAYHPNLQTPILEINNGYDTGYWHKIDDSPKEQFVLAVAVAADEKVFVTKGLDHYIHVAGAMPEFRFVLVGVMPADLMQWWKEPLPPNLELRPTLTAPQLRELYSRAKVFAHFTLTEGMPNVLCEAMLCECVPVGSAVNSLPDIIGDTGFVVSRPLIPEMKRAIEQAMQSDLGPAARRRIAERYPLERRKRELLETVDHLLQT